MCHPDIIPHLHAAVRAFDESASPQGLYAIDEYRAGATPKPRNLTAWQSIIRPTLERLEYEAMQRASAKSLTSGRFDFFGHGRSLTIELVRVSKIKVRRYGNAYRLDPHFDFAERWNELRLAGRIRAKVHPIWDDERILLLIAFAKGPRGLDHELSAVHDKLGATEQSAIYTKDQWPDPHGRGFETLCASWYWPAACRAASV